MNTARPLRGTSVHTGARTQIDEGKSRGYVNMSWSNECFV